MNSTLNKLLKLIRQKPSYKRLSESVPAQKMISTLYRSFAIPNVVGNLSPSIGWTTRLVDPPTLGVDGDGRFKITTVTEEPLYLVGQGNEREFRTLSQESGFPTAGFNSVRVSARLVGENNARASVVLLEFDQQRNRIGELSIAPSSKVRGNLLPNTRFILPTIRIAGVGVVTIEWLHLELVQSDSSGTKSKDRIESLQASELAIADSRFTAIKDELAKLKSTVDRVDSELDEYYITGSGGGTTENQTSARSGSNISMNRESMARELLIQMANSLPESNGTHHFEKIPLVAGLITDEYMFNFYKDVFEEAVYLSPDNFEEILDDKSPDLILYVTCWKGMENEEWKGVKFREKPMKALDSILEYAKQNNKATIFQSIEDPSNFEYFLPVAEKFDWVFTSDADVVEDYKLKLGHDRVFYGEYGANPSVNNPIGSFRFNLNRAFFAGSYPERYPERCADMKQIFSSIPSRDENLVILDRNFNSDGYEFPSEFQSSILGPVPHAVLQKIHKLFRVSLNFNSIKASPTMCAMRVYELQAQGKPIISNYARSVFNRFPGVRIVAHDTQLSELSSPDPYYEELERSNALMTQLFAEKSSFHVVSDMLQSVGLPGAISRNSEILVVAVGDVDEVRESVKRQIGVSAEVISEEDFKTGETSLSDYGYVTAMSSELDYEPTYLRSRINVFVYTDTRFATQRAFFGNGILSDGEIHEYVDVATRREVTVASTMQPRVMEFFSGMVTNLEGIGYAADPFGIAYSQYLSDNLRSELAPEPTLSVVIPVYNNGNFLETKCIPSLRRNNIWGQMEILLVDDGSTDSVTKDISEQLSKRYENIRIYSYNDGGSGSASRPRNKGIELATSALVTFLDPDNEISSQGYDNLVAEFQRLSAESDAIDFVSGFQVKVGETVKFTGRHAAGDTRVITSGKNEFFDLGKFPVVSTQAAVIRKSMLQNNDIKFVERAAGQDTLYGWEVLGKARIAAFVDSAYILYFAEREGSVTNVLDPNYFWKCLELERVQVPFLKEIGVFDTFKQGQFDYFMRNWYVMKLAQVGENGQDEAREALSQIATLYGVELTDYMN